MEVVMEIMGFRSVIPCSLEEG